MDIEDLIYVPDKRLDGDFCKHCIEKFKKDDNRYQGVTGSGVDLKMKKSTDLKISAKDNWKEEDNVFYESFKDTYASYENWLSDNYSPLYLDACLRGHIEDTGYQIQETLPGGFYNYHHDGMHDRLLTIIWYLNDIHEDGYTEFYSGLKIQPEEGKIMMFPALWPWVHRGFPPKSETKYICTGWIRCNSFDYIN